MPGSISPSTRRSLTAERSGRSVITTTSRRSRASAPCCGINSGRFDTRQLDDGVRLELVLVLGGALELRSEPVKALARLVVLRLRVGDVRPDLVEVVPEPVEVALQ